MCGPPSYRKGGLQEGSVCNSPSYRRFLGRDLCAVLHPTGRAALGRDLCAVLRPTGRAALGRDPSVVLHPTGRAALGRDPSVVLRPTGRAALGSDLCAVLRPTGESSGGICLPFSILQEGQSFLSHSLRPFLRQPHHKEVVGDSEKHVMLALERLGAEPRSPAKARCSSPSRGSGARTGILLAECDRFSPIPLPSPRYSSSCPPPSARPENRLMSPTLPWPSCLHARLPVASCCSCRHQLASPLQSAGRISGHGLPPTAGQVPLALSPCAAGGKFAAQPLTQEQHVAIASWGGGAESQRFLF